MKSSDVLREAAMLVDEDVYEQEHKFACHAIAVVKHEFNSCTRAMDIFQAYLRPTDQINYSAWFGDNTDETNRQYRVLALLFAAEIAESEGD